MKHLKLYEEYMTPTTTVQWKERVDTPSGKEIVRPGEQPDTNSPDSSEPDVQRGPQTQEERTRNMNISRDLKASSTVSSTVAQVNLYSDLEQKKMAKQGSIDWAVCDKAFHKETSGLIPDITGFMHMTIPFREKKDKMQQQNLTWKVHYMSGENYFLDKGGVANNAVNKIRPGNPPRLYNKDFSQVLINRYLNKNSSGEWVKKQSPSTSARLPYTFE